MKGEKHTQMKYVNKLPSHKHNFSLMATLQSGPPGQREMSIFITRPPAQPTPPHPTPFWEGGRQATCPYLPRTLSLQPKKRGSVRRRQFPWNIRIKRTWKEGKGWKGKLITQKWIRNIVEKKQEGSSGGGRAGLGVPFENGPWTENCRTQVERERGHLSLSLFESYQLSLQRFAPHFCQTASQEDTSLLLPLKASVMLEVYMTGVWHQQCRTVLEWYGTHQGRLIGPLKGESHRRGTARSRWQLGAWCK